MDQILRCDWLPEQARLRYLARSGIPAVRQENVVNSLLTRLVRSRWLDISLAYCFDFMVFRLRLFPLTRKLKKKKLGQCLAVLASRLVIHVEIYSLKKRNGHVDASNVSFNSLSALADVLGALSEHRSHIPYRNTRLTHMLQDTIGRFSVKPSRIVSITQLLH